MSLQQVLQDIDLDALNTCNVFNETVRAALSSLLQHTHASTTTTPIGSIATHSSLPWIRDNESFSNYTIPDGPPPTSPSQVPWQNVFWALAAIVLNTCMQDCGRVCESPKELGLFLRTSPMYSLLDALVIMFQLCRYSVIHGPRRAAQIVNSCREQHPENESQGNARPIQYIIRALLIVMAVLQSIKLFAMKGVAWTQFFGACYLASYMMNAITNIFGKPPIDLSQEAQPLPRRGDIRPSVRISHWISISAYTLQVVIWVVALEPAMPERLSSLPDNVTDFCLLPLHLLTAVVWIPVYFFGWMIPFAAAPLMVDIILLCIPVAIILTILSVELVVNKPSLAGLLGLLFAVDEATVMTVCGVAAFIGFTLLRLCYIHFWVFQYSLDGVGTEVLVGWMFAKAWVAVDPYFVMLTLILLAGFLSYLVQRLFMFGILARPFRLHETKLANNLAWACMFLFCTNVVAALLYYSKVYDPQNTYRPDWVQRLPRAIR